MDAITLAALQKLGAKVNELQEVVYAAYADLWGHHHALLHVVSRLGLDHAERLETDAQAWFEAHHERLTDEAHDRLAMLAGKKSSPPV